jgi:hypothetical protein
LLFGPGKKNFLMFISYPADAVIVNDINALLYKKVKFILARLRLTSTHYSLSNYMNFSKKKKYIDYVKDFT